MKGDRCKECGAELEYIYGWEFRFRELALTTQIHISIFFDPIDPCQSPSGPDSYAIWCMLCTEGSDTWVTANPPVISSQSCLPSAVDEAVQHVNRGINLCEAYVSLTGQKFLLKHVWLNMWFSLYNLWGWFHKPNSLIAYASIDAKCICAYTFQVSVGCLI